MSGLLPYFVNLRAKVKSGLTDVVFWISAKSDARALREMENALEDADIKRSAFFKDAVITGLPVYNDLPQEGELDFTWCERYAFSDDTGTWLPIAPAQPIQPEPAASDNASISEGHTDENTTDNADSGDTTSAADATAAGSTDAAASTPAYEYNVNGEPMAEVMKKMDWPVVEMSLPMRWMAQMGKDKKVIHLSPEQYGRVMAMTAPQDDDEEPLLNNINLMLVGDMAADIDKLDAHQLFRLVKAVEKVAQKDGRMGLHLLCRFVRAWLDTEYIDQGILVKSWCEGKRISRVEKMQQTTAGDTSDLQNAKDGETGASTRPRRSEKPTHRTINYELGCGFYDDLDFDNLRPAMDFAKRIIAEDREDWKRMSITAGIIPDIKEFDRQTIIDLVRKAPKAVLTGSPELRRTWCESFLAVHGVRDPDWYEYVPNKAATTQEENLETVRKAGKCLRDIEAGRFQYEEETQPTDTLADEPAATETVEPDTTKHHQDSQQVEAESSVAVTDDGDQSQREQASKQLAAERGDFVPGISDPSDPKWVHNDYSASASNEGEKKEVATDSAADTADYVDHQEAFSNQHEPENNHSEPSTNHNKPETPETGPKNQQPEPVTKVADGVFDASVFFATTSNQGEKTEIPQPDNDDRSQECAEEKTTYAPVAEELLLHEIVRLQSINNQLLEACIAYQIRAETRHERFLEALFYGITRFAYQWVEGEEDRESEEKLRGDS